MTCQRSRLVGDSFHQVAVAHQGVGKVIDDGVAGLVVASGGKTLGHGHADRVAGTLTERAGGGFHARDEKGFRVPGGSWSVAARSWRIPATAIFSWKRRARGLPCCTRRWKVLRLISMAVVTDAARSEAERSAPSTSAVWPSRVPGPRVANTCSSPSRYLTTSTAPIAMRKQDEAGWPSRHSQVPPGKWRVRVAARRSSSSVLG